jgi:tripartite-type tricarboxylate transporter receptor subunit TctC
MCGLAYRRAKSQGALRRRGNMMSSGFRCRLLTGCAAVLLGASPALAQAPSFEGKTIRIVVGFAPGGGYDSYARVLSRHMGAHLPGKPTIVVENMPGAGSLTAVRWLDGPAPKDGTAIVAFNPGLITQSVLEPEKIGNVNFLNFAWIGNMARDQRVCYLWGDKVKTFEEMRARKGWNFGTTGVGVSNWVNFKTLQGLFDVDMKIITGFRGSGEQRIAIERGEVDGDCGSWSSISEDWIANNKITTVLKLSRELPPGAPNNVPYANDIAKNDADRAVLNVINGAGEIGRPIITSRQVPADTQAVLRKAFNAALADKATQEEAAKVRLPLQFMSGDEVVGELKRIYEAPPEAVKRARALLAEQ